MRGGAASAAIAAACGSSSAAIAQTAAHVAVTGGSTFLWVMRTDTGIMGDLKNGYAFTGVIGTSLGPIQAEIEGSYRRSSVDGARGFGLELPGTGNACGSAPKQDPPLNQHRRLKLFKNAIFGGVLIGADRDPAQLEIPQQ